MTKTTLVAGGTRYIGGHGAFPMVSPSGLSPQVAAVFASRARNTDMPIATTIVIKSPEAAHVRAGVWQNERRSAPVTFAWKSHRAGCNFFH